MSKLGEKSKRRIERLGIWDPRERLTKYEAGAMEVESDVAESEDSDREERYGNMMVISEREGMTPFEQKRLEKLS